MHTIKQTILTNWHFMRWLRLAFGLALIIQGIYLRDAVPGFVGAWFSYMALLNVSCCGVNGCDINQKSSDIKSQENFIEDVTFVEVKEKQILK